jgi:hypothetical protein
VHHVGFTILILMPCAEPVSTVLTPAIHSQAPPSAICTVRVTFKTHSADVKIITYLTFGPESRLAMQDGVR